MIAFYADSMPNSQANTDIRPKVPLLNPTFQHSVQRLEIHLYRQRHDLCIHFYALSSLSERAETADFGA